jgi:hypothetical protein
MCRNTLHMTEVGIAPNMRKEIESILQKVSNIHTHSLVKCKKTETKIAAGAAM